MFTMIIYVDVSLCFMNMLVLLYCYNRETGRGVTNTKNRLVCDTVNIF